MRGKPTCVRIKGYDYEGEEKDAEAPSEQSKAKASMVMARSKHGSIPNE